MNVLKNIFQSKEKQILNYQDFWEWFQLNEKSFFNAIKNGSKIEQKFFDKLSPKLAELKDGIFFLSGMFDDNVAELVFTPDGCVKNIVFIEELVGSAPIIQNWKFTALKPELDIENVSINMAGYDFNGVNLHFYPIEQKEYPDEIDIAIVYDNYSDNDKSTVTNGTYIFLDNFLGEMNSVTLIDNLEVISKNKAEKELIPISKLKDYLKWREKEFIEKYDGVRYDTENDSYSSLEAELTNGKPLLAIVNSTLLDWNDKVSHPWILKVMIKYDGSNRNGLPDDETYELLNDFEEEIINNLKDYDGYLNVGRETADNEREIYFACNNFRKSSKILSELILKNNEKLDVAYDIYKDKYWQSFERFRTK